MIITRILLIAYGLSCLAMLLRLIATQLVGKQPTFKDIGNVLLFPLLLMTKQGRASIQQTLKITGETK